MATTRRMRRIQGEKDPLLKLSELTPRERLEVLKVRVRDLKPLLRYMSVQKLEEFRISDAPSKHTCNVGEGLRWDTRALPIHQLLRDDRNGFVKMHWLILTTKGVWIYWDAEGSGTDASSYKTSSSFSLVPQRDLLDMLQGDHGIHMVQQVATRLLQLAANVVRSREQQAQEARRLLEDARRLTRDIVDLQA